MVFRRDMENTSIYRLLQHIQLWQRTNSDNHKDQQKCLSLNILFHVGMNVCIFMMESTYRVALTFFL